MQKFCFLRGWVVFLSKKKLFFSCKTSVFAGLGALFGTFFCHFFFHFSCKISVFCEAGRSFWVKKKTIFSCKTSGFAGLGALFGTLFCHFFVIFLKCANPAGRSARSARGLTRDAKAVSGKPEGTSPCGYQTLSLFAADLLLPSLSVARYEGTTPPS